MDTRQFLAFVIVCVGLTLGSCLPSFAQDSDAQPRTPPTASELYQQFIQSYEKGDNATARDIFRRIDPMQLPKEDRVTLYKDMQRIDQRTAATSKSESSDQSDSQSKQAAAKAQPTAEQLLAQADKVAAKDPAAAAPLYQRIIADPHAAASVKTVASAHLAQAQRAAHPDLSTARRELDLANADVASGDLDRAQARLQAVQKSGVKLGWFDQQRLERLAAVIQERKAQQGETAQAQTKPAAQPQPQTQSASAGQTSGAGPEQAGATQSAAKSEQPAAQSAAAPEAKTPEAKTSQAKQSSAQTSQAPNEDLLKQVRLLSAQQAAAQGRQAEQNGQLNLAVQKYHEALRYNPDMSDVRDRLNKLEQLPELAQSAQSDQGAAGGALQETLKSRQLHAQAVEARYNQSMAAAQSSLKAGDYPAAAQSAEQAKVILDNNQQYLSAQRYQQLRSAAVDLSLQIQRQRAIAQGQAQARQANMQQKGAQEAQQRAQRQQQQQVQTLLQRARDLQRDQKYDQALELINQALFLDPTNIAAQFMQNVLEDSRIYVNARNAMRKRNLSLAQMDVDNLKASTPINQLITYPADWPQITQTRLANVEEVGGESQVDRQVRRKLQQPVPINFDANRLANVIDYFRNTTGLNFFVNWPALEAAGIAQDTPISLQLNNVPADHALTLVLQQASAGKFEPAVYSLINGIVTVSTKRDLQQTTDVRTYDIRDLLVQVPDFTNAPTFDLREALSNTNTGGGGGGGGGGGQAGNLFKEDNEENKKIGPTREELIQQITQLIQDTVGQQQEWAVYGGTVSSVRVLNDQLIIKTTPANHRQITQLLAQLRETRAVQISVEARFLLVDHNFLEEFGIDLDAQINNVGGGFGPIKVAQDSMSMAQRVPTDLTPVPFLPPDAQGGVSEGTTGIGAYVPGTGYPSGTARALDLGVSYLTDDLEVNLLIHATQANQRAITLTAPRVTFFNGERAYVMVVRQIAFISDLEPIPDAAGFDVTVSVVNSGVILDVQGTVSADRRYVTLVLRPSLATVQQPFDTVTITGVVDIPGTGTGGDDDNNDQQTVISGTIQLPELELTQVRATVSVPDKGTILLGGQRLVSETEIASGVPVLSKIPLLSRLFTNTSTVKDSRTLLILVKPTIVIQSEQEQELFPGLLQGPAQYNTTAQPQMQ